MGFREDYNQWPLGRQLQVIFITSGFFLTLVLVIITKFQLDWLRGQVISSSETVITNNLVDHMTKLAELEGSYIQNQFTMYIQQVQLIQELDEIILGFVNGTDQSPFNAGSLKQCSDYSSTQIDFSTGCYQTSLTLDSAGSNLEKNDSPLNSFYPLIFNQNYLGIYQGYETDEILHGYPGSYIDPTYTPVVREWYYKAQDSIHTVIITEPYIDSSSGMWIVTSSKAILDLHGNFYGVAAADITIEQLTQITSNIVILQTGFALLVSAGGMVLTIPEVWSNSGTSALRIYDTTTTGITQTQWAAIEQAPDLSRNDFTDNNGTYYIMIKKNIMPYPGLTNVTHYLLLCAKKNESDVTVNNINNNFSDTYTIIFWVTLSIAIVVFFSIIILIFISTRKTQAQLKMIEKVFAKLIRRGLFPKITKGVSFAKLDNKSQGIESLVDACKEKIQKIKDKEENFSYFKWGFTRPNDDLLFIKWNNCLYPYNYYTDRALEWRKILPNLNKVIDR